MLAGGLTAACSTYHPLDQRQRRALGQGASGWRRARPARRRARPRPAAAGCPADRYRVQPGDRLSDARAAATASASGARRSQPARGAVRHLRRPGPAHPGGGAAAARCAGHAGQVAELSAGALVGRCRGAGLARRWQAPPDVTRRSAARGRAAPRRRRSLCRAARRDALVDLAAARRALVELAAANQIGVALRRLRRPAAAHSRPGRHVEPRPRRPEGGARTGGPRQAAGAHRRTASCGRSTAR